MPVIPKNYTPFSIYFIIYSIYFLSTYNLLFAYVYFCDHCVYCYYFNYFLDITNVLNPVIDRSLHY